MTKPQDPTSPHCVIASLQLRSMLILEFGVPFFSNTLNGLGVGVLLCMGLIKPVIPHVVAASCKLAGQ